MRRERSAMRHHFGVVRPSPPCPSWHQPCSQGGGIPPPPKGQGRLVRWGEVRAHGARYNCYNSRYGPARATMLSRHRALASGWARW